MQQDMTTMLRHEFQTKFDQIDQKLVHDNKLLKIELIKAFEKANQHTNNIETKITTQLADLRDSSNLFETRVSNQFQYLEGMEHRLSQNMNDQTNIHMAKLTTLIQSINSSQQQTETNTSTQSPIAKRTRQYITQTDAETPQTALQPATTIEVQQTQMEANVSILSAIEIDDDNSFPTHNPDASMSESLKKAMEDSQLNDINEQTTQQHEPPPQLTSHLLCTQSSDPTHQNQHNTINQTAATTVGLRKRCPLLNDE
jgi:hypothetical protein